MLGLVIFELCTLAVLWTAFAVLNIRGGGWRTPTGRQLIAMAGVGLIEAVGLVALGTGHAPPLWVYAAVFGIADAVVLGWLVLLWRARNDGRSPADRAETPS